MSRKHRAKNTKLLTIREDIHDRIREMADKESRSIRVTAEKLLEKALSDREEK